MTPAVAVGFAAAWVSRQFRRRPLTAGFLAGFFVMLPVPCLVVTAVIVLVKALRRVGSSRRVGADEEEDLVLLADLITLGLASGLPLAAALRRAADEVGGSIGREVHDVLRNAVQTGLAGALVGAEGSTGRLLRLAARASATGAPIASAVAAYAAEERHTIHADRLDTARKLPVRLMLPLALLVLPGFVVLVVGPVLLDSLARLGPIP